MGAPLLWMKRALSGSLAGRLFEADQHEKLNNDLYEGPFPVFRDPGESSEVEELKQLLRDLHTIRPGQPGCGDFSREQRTYADLTKFIQKDTEAHAIKRVM